MTCIIAYSENGTDYIAADSRVTSGDLIFQSAESKYNMKERILYASCGECRQRELLTMLAWKKRETKRIDEYLRWALVPQLRKFMEKEKFLYQSNGQAALNGSTIFIGDNRIFTLCSRFNLLEISQAFFCDGSGCELATGAMEVLQHSSISPEEKLRQALAVASKHIASVGPPFHVISSGARKSAKRKKKR